MSSPLSSHGALHALKGTRPWFSGRGDLEHRAWEKSPKRCGKRLELETSMAGAWKDMNSQPRSLGPLGISAQGPLQGSTEVSWILSTAPVTPVCSQVSGRNHGKASELTEQSFSDAETFGSTELSGNQAVGW